MAEGFLRRWSRIKSAGEPAAPVDTAPAPATAFSPVTAPAREPASLPTLADVAQLGTDADFGRFVAPEVDSAVRRLALKKMFADPHFNAIDGLDIYMSDYTKADPIPAAMMAALQHARSVFGGEEEKEAGTARDPAEPPFPDPAEPAEPAEPGQADPAALALTLTHTHGAPASTPSPTAHADDTTA